VVIVVDVIPATVIDGVPVRLDALVALVALVAVVALPLNVVAVIVPEPALMLLFCVVIVVDVIPATVIDGVPVRLDALVALVAVVALPLNVEAVIVPEPALMLLFCVVIVVDVIAATVIDGVPVKLEALVALVALVAVVALPLNVVAVIVPEPALMLLF
jgi:hypothetical protein